MSRRVRGMSLLEMLLVLALIAGIGVLGMSVFGGGLQGVQLRSSAKAIAAQLRYTRALAVSTGTPQRFELDPATHRWRAPNGRSGEIPPAVRVTFTGAREVQARRGEGAIVFFEDGASTGGRVQLSARQAAWNVDVAWLTGEVRVRRAGTQR